LVTKRFSGGGTVVLDVNSIWTTFIGRNKDFLPHGVEPFPRSIMKWTAESLFGPAFTKLENGLSSVPVDEHKTTASDMTTASGFGHLGDKNITKMDSDVLRPRFRLRENDYVLGDFKMGGNAQSIVKDGWLHHTSFLWDYEASHMQYLMLPKKRPDYRGERSHRDFLVRLKSIYGDSSDIFVSSLHTACSQTALDVESVPLSHVMEEVVNSKLGGMDTWFEKCRTRILHKLE
jgi:lipoate-protein ligase A